MRAARGGLVFGAWLVMLTGLCLSSPPDRDYPFIEVAQTSGISFVHQNSPTSQKYMMEILGGAAAMLDFDGDGWLDLYFINGAGLNDPMQAGEKADKTEPRYWNRLYHNRRDGSFQDVTGKAGVKGVGFGMGAAVGDYDNDGDPDIYLTNLGPNILYRNNGDGTFTNVTDPSATNETHWSSSAAFFDYDNDGWLDLYVVNYLDYTFAQNRYCGEQRPGFRSYCGPTNFPGVPDSLFRNNQDGTFTNLAVTAGVASPDGKGLGVVTGDYDLDGYQDLYVANDSVMNFLYKGSAEHKFEETALLANVGYSGQGAAEAGMGTDLGDFDEDGLPDLVVTNLSFEGTTLYRNEGDGFFSDVSLQAGLQKSLLMVGFGTRFFDLENDGDLDLFSANGHIVDNVHLYHDVLSYRQPKQLYENVGGRFVHWGERAGPLFTTPNVGRGAAFGDLNNDGSVDIVVANCGGAAEVLLNQAGKTNHWLMVHLVGSRSNKDGVGARLSLKVGDRTIHRQKQGGGSYLSAHDGRLHFGLGSAQRAEHLEILWPSGQRQSLQNLEANQILTVTEP